MKPPLSHSYVAQHARVTTTYAMWTNMIQEMKNHLEQLEVHPEFQVLIQELRSKDTQLRNLMIDQANKSMPVDVGGVEFDLHELLDTPSDSTGVQVRKRKAKDIARTLYSHYHADTAPAGVDPTHFGIIRKAAILGDLEVLQYFRYLKNRFVATETPGPNSDVGSLIAVFRVRMNLLQASNSYRVTRLLLSGQKEEAFLEYKRLLQARIQSLDNKILGISHRTL